MKRSIFYLLVSSILLLPYFNCVFAQPVGFMSPQVVKQTQPQCLFSPKGRFVFGQISDSSKDQFMLDTWTGRLWRISESGAVGKFLTPVPYKLEDGKYSPVPTDIAPTVQKENKK